VLISSVLLTFICSYTAANNLPNNNNKKKKIYNVHLIKHWAWIRGARILKIYCVMHHVLQFWCMPVIPLPLYWKGWNLSFNTLSCWNTVSREVLNYRVRNHCLCSKYLASWKKVVSMSSLMRLCSGPAVWNWKTTVEIFLEAMVEVCLPVC